MPSWSVADARLTLGDAELTLRDVVSIPAPAPFTSGGIGGGLSPQQLHPAAVTVLDLVVDELLLVEGSDDAVEEWLVERAPSLTTLSLEREPGFATVVVPAAVRPFADVSTLLNTGGKRTEFVSAASRESTRARRSGLGAASAAPTSSARRPAPRRSRSEATSCRSRNSRYASRCPTFRAWSG